MRFASLDLIRYGHFENCRLEFRTNAPDLHIIFGPNEAGKTTTMAAVSDLLFGFGARTSYNFRHDSSLLRVGAVLEHQKQRTVVRRRKGNRNTLLDEAEQPIEESILSAMLSGQTNESYKRMFSLDHHRLREGGKTILDAADDVGQALFAAGSGLVGLKRLLDELEHDADEIWTKNNRSNHRRFHVAQGLYTAARERLRKATVKPLVWVETSGRIDELERDLQTLREQRSVLQRQRSDRERVRRVMSPCAQLRHLQEELKAIGMFPLLPDEAEQTLRHSEEATARAADNIDRDTEEWEKIGAELRAISIEPRLLERQGEIESLLRKKGEVTANQHDLPNRHRDLAYAREQLVKLQHEMGWAGWSVERITEQLPQRSRISELRSLLEERQGIQAAKGAAEQQAADRRDDLSRLQGEKAKLALPPDVEILSIALKQAQTASSAEAQFAAAIKQMEKQHAACLQAVAGLAPWQGSMEELAGLVIPAEEVLNSAAEQWRNALRATEEARNACRRLKQERERLQLEQEQTIRDSQAVSQEQLEAARESRDTLWNALRADAERLNKQAEQYQGAVRFADELADRRYLAAEASAKLMQLTRSLQQKELEVRQAEAVSAQAQEREQAAREEWHRLLAKAKLPLFSPEALRDWIRRREAALRNEEQRRETVQTIEGLRSQIDEAKAVLVASLPGADAVLPFRVLMERAEQMLGGAQKLRQEQKVLEGRIDETQAALRKAERTLSAKLDDEQRWTLRWNEAVKGAGLDRMASVAVIKAQLDTAEEIRGVLDRILDLQHRIETMEANNEAFSKQVRQLAEWCGSSGNGPATEQIEQLAAAVGKALRQADQRKDLEQRRQRIETCLQQWRDDRREGEQRLLPLLMAAGTSDKEQLREMIAKQREASNRQTQIAKLEQEIWNSGDGQPLAELLAATEATNYAELTEQMNALEREEEEVSAQIERKSADHATARAQLQAISDGAEAATAAAEQEEAKAAMELEAESYLRKRAQAAILQLTIRKYQEQRQGPLLKRASELFAMLTVGRYERLCADYDGDVPRLLGQRGDSTTTPVTAMSEGTRDQVYLALRLAAVEQMIDGGTCVPFLADDLFINFDDERSGAGLRVLQALACRTQVLFFTHHQHLLEIARQELGPCPVSVCVLG
jgi:uncharacterized protein YhaN